MNTLYILNLYNVTCQLHLSKVEWGGEIKRGGGDVSGRGNNKRKGPENR